MPWFFLVSTLCVILLLSMALAVYFYNRRGRVNQFFSQYLAVIIGWVIPASMYITFSISVAELILVQMMPGAFIGTMFYFFSRAVYRSDYSIQPVEYLLFIPPAIIMGYKWKSFFFRNQTAIIFLQRINQ